MYFTLNFSSEHSRHFFTELVWILGELKKMNVVSVKMAFSKY